MTNKPLQIMISAITYTLYKTAHEYIAQLKGKHILTLQAEF